MSGVSRPLSTGNPGSTTGHVSVSLTISSTQYVIFEVRFEASRDMPSHQNQPVLIGSFGINAKDPMQS